MKYNRLPLLSVLAQCFQTWRVSRFSRRSLQISLVLSIILAVFQMRPFMENLRGLMGDIVLLLVVLAILWPIGVSMARNAFVSLKYYTTTIILSFAIGVAFSIAGSGVLPYLLPAVFIEDHNDVVFAHPTLYLLFSTIFMALTFIMGAITMFTPDKPLFPHVGNRPQ